MPTIGLIKPSQCLCPRKDLNKTANSSRECLNKNPDLCPYCRPQLYYMKMRKHPDCTANYEICIILVVLSNKLQYVQHFLELEKFTN